MEILLVLGVLLVLLGGAIGGLYVADWLTAREAERIRRRLR